MYLKKLSIQGFKSFVSLTDLNFDPGITAIVGPNGCGKSNIVDALRWVIGEQRARVLRSGKMDSVIFNGTTSRRAVGLAEVQLTIANNRGVLPLEYSEVILGRRLYRSGEAEYLLNGVECRLRDITDLFTDTGMGAGAYSVIELKMIDEILSENTQDRRRLFEEASGITRYKKRRGDALRKLDQMQSDLARVRDLTDEISKRVRSLKRQATIAERYLRYKAELRTAQMNLLKLEYSRLLTDEKNFEDEIIKISDTCAGLTAQVRASGAQFEALRTRFVAEEKRAQRNRQAFVEHEQRIIKLEGDLRLEEANRQTIAQNVRRLKVDRETTAVEREALASQRESTEKQFSGALSEANKTSQLLDQASTERDIVRDQLKTVELQREALEETVKNLDQQKLNHHRHFDLLQGRIIHLKEEQNRLKSEWKSEEKANETASREAEDAAKAFQEAQKKLDRARGARQEAEVAHAALERKISRAEGDIGQVERELAAKRAEVKILEDLVSTYDFFPDAVRYLLTEAKDIQVTTLSDLITCAPEYRAALAAALGPYGGCIVVETERVAKMAAERLRSEDMGRAYFIVLENIPIFLSSSEPPPDALLTLVALRDEVYRPVAELLLRDVFLVESLDMARNMLDENGGKAYRYITSQGEWVDGRGVLYAGGSEEGGTYSHLSRRDSLRVAKDACSELQRQVDHEKSTLAGLHEEQRQIALYEVIDRAREADQLYVDADRTAQKHAQIRELGSGQLNVLTRRQHQIAQEIANLEEEAQPGSGQLVHIDEKLSEAQENMKSIDHEIQSCRGQLEEMQNAYLHAHMSAVQAVAKRERLEGDLQRIEQRQLHLHHQTEVHEEEHDALIQMQQDASVKISELAEFLQVERTCRSDLNEIKTEDSTREHELRIELERTNEHVRKAQRSFQAAKEEETNVQIKYSAVKARREDLQVRAREEYQFELSGMPEFEEVDDVILREEIQETERKLQSMGNVNALALEEYNKQNERLEFMMEQRTDLEEAERVLVQTIKEINRTASKQFLDTYVLIRENFQKLFCELFGEKAKCELDLTEPDDVLESPIAVIARPSGKRPVSIAQLSSGEKTLTAIALLFAIYLIKPSPFCFLDEVDAPLDDANVDHFMQMIRRFSTETQFILVTHNKRTMEMANRLYGVTMQEEGVSSLVSVRFEEAVALGE
ncbi:MAG: chromosome segregation protein SMC [Rhodothermaceae bacterium]|nr:chromosome segregation protein SMC [Rhodothermaceae bacterium]MYC03494.1 chromosome segregation protein SMC [Rhodothermaceae bacterium]MYI17860.1 chromosome segregation protein SMC [Rhodothermaceae bacterium]